MKEIKKFYMDGNISVYRQKGYKQPPHLHSFIEFVYIINGKYVHIVDNVEYAVSKGDLVIINYKQTHSFISDANSEHFNILIKPEFVDAQIKNRDDVFALLDVSEFKEFKNLIDCEKSVVHFSVEERNRFESIIQLVCNELNNQEVGYQLTAHSYINLILIMIFRKMSKFSFPSKNTIDEEFLSYIKEHCHEKLTLSMLAYKYHYNTSYFSRIFKEYTGMSFAKYLKNIRIRRSCELLANTDIKIEDISIKTGYSNKTKFFKDFREYTGTTPLKYRTGKK